MPRYQLFRKMVIGLLIMLVPIVGLYFYSNTTSTKVLRSELDRSNTNQLVFFQSQLSANMENLGLWPNLMIQDPDILSLKESILDPGSYLDLDRINLVKRIQTKLNVQESSSNWRSSLSIYYPALHRVVSVNNIAAYDEKLLKQELRKGWQVAGRGEPGGETYEFSLFTVYPYSAFRHPESADVIIEVRFDGSNIADMLDKFKSDGRSDPLYYRQGEGVIYNRTADRPLAAEIIRALGSEQPADSDSRTIQVGGSSYLVNIVKSNTTGWYLIDYMPLGHIFKPIDRSNRLFYTSVGCLLLMSFLAAYVLYSQVQVPLKRLIAGFQHLKNGDYGIRLPSDGRNEFGFVFTRFNLMVAQIQDLFEKVYLEKLHAREARLKQLQSQINPHFFYNCFSFISSMAKLKNHDAVIAMSQNLSKYYRYTTRQERDMVPLAEELDFVNSYLLIQTMRMSRLQYSLELPAAMRRLDIPLLVVQPLVENAVIHGIEKTSSARQIRIRGECGEGGVMRIAVEDDGRGMSADAIAALQQKLGRPMDEEMGCGLWNVHQRMQLIFGEGAGLTFAPSQLGGLKAVLAWTPKRPEPEMPDDGDAGNA